MSRSSSYVERVLRDNHKARNSDKELIAEVWNLQMGGTMHPKLKAFLVDKAISPETIRRTRQKLQQDGKYKADEAVDEERFKKFQAVKHNIKSTQDVPTLF